MYVDVDVDVNVNEHVHGRFGGAFTNMDPFPAVLAPAWNPRRP